ncbi:hypothetical protein [Argonema antarcticum]|uniref:hypothetical protein n=1 Tax=Argonema antarcticum TaxID=2942763 RepID=UPI00201353E8|nr:hypothetical protein [Argonema antarcticum]MCL1475988.1 hypothetical protein [Argonema antarcticum A004/B2]
MPYIAGRLRDRTTHFTAFSGRFVKGFWSAIAQRAVGDRLFPSDINSVPGMFISQYFA